MHIYGLYILIIIHCSSSILSKKISPCARWNKTGITVAGIRNQPGNSTSHLNRSRSIFIRQSANTLYVADTNNNRIQMFTLNQLSMEGTTVVSTKTAPRRIYIDDEDNRPMIYISFFDSNRVEKWIDGATSGIQVGSECFMCDDIVVDKEKNVYMTETIPNRIIQWLPKTNTTTIVAGGGSSNSSLDERLLLPQGIHIDKNDGSVYVADCMYHRIQKWAKGAKKGITVAGSSTFNPGDKSNLLNCPNTVLVDEDIDMMYIVDGMDDQVERWFINATEGEIIVDRSSLDGEHGDFTDIAFDNEGNIYVCDQKYHHVQMFALIDNRPCSGIETTTPKNRAISSNENLFHWFIIVIIAVYQYVSKT